MFLLNLDKKKFKRILEHKLPHENIIQTLSKLKSFENLAKIEDFSNIGEKLKIFEILVKIEDF